MSDCALTPTLEDYLEAIFQIVAVHKVARSMEIADRLLVKRSSVTVALRSLAEKELINYRSRSYVTLTEKGLAAARCVDRRHHVLRDMFTSVLGLPHQEADRVACSMEHGMSAEVCRKMTAFLLAMQQESQSAAAITCRVEHCAAQIDCPTGCHHDSCQSGGRPHG